MAIHARDAGSPNTDFLFEISVKEPPEKKSEVSNVAERIISSTSTPEGNPPSKEAEEKMQRQWMGTRYLSLDTSSDTQRPREYRPLLQQVPLIFLQQVPLQQVPLQQVPLQQVPLQQVPLQQVPLISFMTIPDNESPPGSKVNSDSGQLPSGSESVVYFSLPSSDNPSNSATGSSDFGYDDSGRPTFRGEAVRILSNHPKAKARRRRKGLENPDGKLLKMLSQTPNAKRVRKRYYRPLEEKFPVFLQDKLHSK